jgi:hypothetical protein
VHAIRQIGRFRPIQYGALVAMLAVGGTGCASPETRIRKEPELFAQFAPAVQEKIRAGTIDIGFSAPMVQMALGRPSRVYRRTSQEGVQEIWSYRELTPGTYSHAYAFSGLCPNYRSCRRLHCPYFHHAYHTPPRSVERMRVTFEHDVVSAIEVLDSERGIP